jgi:prepilin-type N-terminal cleavage/methylation domain-containing protein
MVNKKNAFTLMELLVVIAIIALLVAILLPSLKRAKELAKRTSCGMNLHSIGQQVHLYATRHNAMLPSAPGFKRDCRRIGLCHNLHFDFMKAYPLSNTRSWFLLLKEGFSDKLGYWRCPSDTFVTDEEWRYVDHWDFKPPDDDKSPISYSMQQNKYKGSQSGQANYDGLSHSVDEPGNLAIGADHNGLLDYNGIKTKAGYRYADYVRNSVVLEDSPKMNSVNHGRDGQKVLFMDSHVEWTSSALCGPDGDNIWTYWDPNDSDPDMLGVDDDLSRTARKKRDSFLVP